MISETRGRSGGPGTRCLRKCEANFWILDASVVTFGRHIMDLGVLLGVLRGRFGFDLWSKIEMSTRISEIQESMLSPAWEHDFPMVCRCF